LLRPASPTDLDAISALLEASSLPTEGVVDHLASFVVFESDGKIRAAGGLEVYGKLALLRSLVVAQASRARGVGGRICDRLEAAARERGVIEVFLLTETAADFFVRRGYATVDRGEAPAAIAKTREFSALCPESATLLRLKLAG
jgi:amino-acid N-acetyltransferase